MNYSDAVKLNERKKLMNTEISMRRTKMSEKHRIILTWWKQRWKNSRMTWRSCRTCVTHALLFTKAFRQSTIREILSAFISQHGKVFQETAKKNERSLTDDITLLEAVNKPNRIQSQPKLSMKFSIAHNNRAIVCRVYTTGFIQRKSLYPHRNIRDENTASSGWFRRGNHIRYRFAGTW